MIRMVVRLAVLADILFELGIAIAIRTTLLVEVLMHKLHGGMLTLFVQSKRIAVPNLRYYHELCEEATNHHCDGGLDWYSILGLLELLCNVYA